MSLPLYLSVKEIWYNRGRFLLVSLIVALITTLVLFIAALGEGLGSGNREYLEKLDGEIVVFQSGVDLSLSASRIGRSRMTEIRRVEGVADLGQVSVANGTVILDGDQAPLDVSLFGVEAGTPGEPPAFEGRNLSRNRANEVVIDGNVAERSDLQVGDILTLKTIQGTDEELHELEIVGISDGRSYFIRPGIFVPYLTWEKVRPQADPDSVGTGELVSNIVVVKLENPDEFDEVQARLETEVNDIEAVDRVTAYEAAPGYTAQQSTLDTQRYFTFFIGLLVIGGFFQIQTLQKVALIGMLKAIGASTLAIGLSAMLQIVITNAVGVALGALGSFALSLTFPPGVPIVFTGDSAITAIIALMLIGPIGGLVSIWFLLRVEPLTALGLAQ